MFHFFFLGVCNATSGLCICEPPWIGPECSALDLLPVHPKTGYQNVTNGEPISSWGGCVVGDDKGGYLMFFSEMLSHCGIGSWAYNSHVMMGYSNSAIGPYKAVKEIFPAFAHEPTVVRGPKGEYVVWFTRYQQVNLTSPCLGVCTNGSTIKSECAAHEPTAEAIMQTWMSWTMDPFGEWTEPVMLYNGSDGNNGDLFTGDTNLSPVIYPNGTLVGLWRGHGPDPASGQDTAIGGIFVVRATNWKDPTTYDWGHVLLKNSIMKIDNPPFGAVIDDEEDPHVYLDAKGRLHAVVHLFGFGAHLASSDGGYNWRYYGPVYYGSDHSDPQLWTKSLWSENIEVAGGGQIDYHRRERPHLIFDQKAQIVAYSVGITLDSGPGDYCWTMFQPTVLFS